MIGVIDSKNRAIADDDFAAWIDNYVLLYLRLLLRRKRNAGTDHADRVSTKLIDRHANLAQGVAELLLLLPLH